jgi:sugar lactone lactonase YvrE
LGNPCALALDEESLWLADSSSSQIHRYFFDTEYLSRISIQMA